MSIALIRDVQLLSSQCHVVLKVYLLTYLLSMACGIA